MNATTWLVTNIYSDSTTATAYIDARGLAAGNYCTAVRVEAFDASSHTLSYLDVAATVTVTPKASSSSSSSVSSSSSSSSSVSSSASSSTSSSIPADLAWGTYDGQDTPQNASPNRFTLITGTTLDSLNRTVYFHDIFTAQGDGTTLVDSRSILPLDRGLVRSPAILTTGTTYPKYLTYLMRVGPAAGATYDNTNRLLNLELSLGNETNDGSRVVMTLRNDTVSGVAIDQFEESSTIALQGAIADMSVPHIYQVSIVLTGPRSGSLTIYADGSDTPIVPTVSSTDLRKAWLLSRNFIQIGDNASGTIASSLDWMLWTNKGAYKPSDLKGKLPSGLGVTTGY
ncbi:MAG: hypothetical protein QM639_04250 [Rhodocyclaceae bacterium]